MGRPLSAPSTARQTGRRANAARGRVGLWDSSLFGTTSTVPGAVRPALAPVGTPGQPSGRPRSHATRTRSPGPIVSVRGSSSAALRAPPALHELPLDVSASNSPISRISPSVGPLPAFTRKALRYSVVISALRPKKLGARRVAAAFLGRRSISSALVMRGHRDRSLWPALWRVRHAERLLRRRIRRRAYRPAVPGPAELCEGHDWLTCDLDHVDERDQLSMALLQRVNRELDVLVPPHDPHVRADTSYNAIAEAAHVSPSQLHSLRLGKT